MTKEKILKIKVGELYNPKTKETFPIYKTAWKRISKDGKEYWVCEEHIFINEVELDEKIEVKTSI